MGNCLSKRETEDNDGHTCPERLPLERNIPNVESPEVAGALVHAGSYAVFPPNCKMTEDSSEETCSERLQLESDISNVENREVTGVLVHADSNPYLPPRLESHEDTGVLLHTESSRYHPPNLDGDGDSRPDKQKLSLAMQSCDIKHGAALMHTSIPRNLVLRNILLVGKTGTGKSSSCNTILGRKVFKAATSSVSVTRVCRKESGEVAGREITLVDTPGLFDTDQSEQELKQELSKCINMTSPGPHAIVLVIQLGPFTTEEQLSVKKIRAIFGEGADKYTMILFTHGDELTSNIDEYVQQAHKDLKQIVYQCGQRYHVFDNTKIDNRKQVLEFLEKVDRMVDSNGGEYFTNTLYQNVEKLLKEKEEELRRLYERKLKKQKMKLESKFNEEKHKLEEAIKTLKETSEEKERKIKQLQLLDKQKNGLMLEYKRYYDEKLRTIRQELEQTLHEDIFLVDVLRKLKCLSPVNT